MNSWKEIWISYHKEATQTRLFIETIKCANLFEKTLLAIALIIFILSAIAYAAYKMHTIGMIFLISSELAILYELDILRKRLISNELGDIKNSQVPPEADEKKESRYMLFKKRLQTKNINANDVESCFELVDLQIDINKSTNIFANKFRDIIILITLGAISSIWKIQNTTQIYIAIAALIIISLPTYLFLSVFSSKLERLNEMKYFMKLYCRELPKNQIITSE